MDTVAFKKLKKAYFEGKLVQYLNDLLAKGEAIDSEEIIAHLEKFKEERADIIADFKEYLDSEELPSIEVLYDKDADPASVEEWKNNRDYAIRRAISILKDTARAIAQRQNIDVNSFSDFAHELTGLTYFLDQDVVFKKREWKVKQIYLMDKYRCSRKEAEDYSYATDEYVSYKNAYNLRQEVENFIVNSRKEFSR
mgnify:CR=1 FL=1